MSDDEPVDIRQVIHVVRDDDADPPMAGSEATGRIVEAPARPQVRDLENPPLADTSSPEGVIQAEQLLRPGSGDARNVLVVWYVRKSFYPLLFLGLIGAFTSGRTDTSIQWSDPGEVLGDILSPLAGLVLSVVVRISANLASLALAYPLARDRDRTLAPRTGFTRGLSRFLDLRQITRAYRSLRWSHHVRQEALRRVAPNSSLKWKLDQIFDVTTIALFVAAFVAIVFSASTA